MSLGPTRKSTWAVQSAIVITRANNLHMLLRELMRSWHWTVTESTDSVDVAIEAASSGSVSMVIVDDTPEMPSIQVLRQLMTHPMTVITPTLAFALEQNKGELAAIAIMGRPETVDKPLTPSKFIPGFQALIRRWEDGPWLALRQASTLFLGGNMGSGLRQLAKLCDQPAVQTLCSLALAIHLRNMGKLKEAETVMLACLKRAPRDLGALVGLGDLYMHAAMPKLAHRIFAGARNAYSGSTIPFADLAQVALMMGDVDEAINHLYTLLKSGMIPDKVPGWLARLLYAEGRDEEAERILSSNRSTWTKMQSAWNSAESANNINAAS